MKVLVGSESDDLTDLYREPSLPWLRVNFVTTVDGSVSGADGRSGSINNDADHQVFAHLRGWADVIVVGAGTARAEGYRVADVPLVLVSRSGEVPEGLRDAPGGAVLMATTSSGAEVARAFRGADDVLDCGDDEVDLRRLRELLVARGHNRILCEGGPTLFAEALAQGIVDELDSSIVPQLVGGDGPRMAAGPPVDVPLRLHTLLEHEGTLLARWLVEPRNK